jgi:hypothetical protein
MNPNAEYLKGLHADAQRLLAGWSAAQIDSVWLGLHAVVAAWKLEHGDRAGDAADWIGWLGGLPELDNLLAEVEQIDLAATDRLHKALPRLLAVAVIKAVASGDSITATKAIGPVRDSLKQASRREGAHSTDIVTLMIIRYLRANPTISNAELERHVLDSAEDHPLFNRPETTFVLDYIPHRAAGNSKTLTHIRLHQRIHKVRHRLGIPVPKRAATAMNPCGMPSGAKQTRRSHQRPMVPGGADICKKLEEQQ